MGDAEKQNDQEQERDAKSHKFSAQITQCNDKQPDPSK